MLTIFTRLITGLSDVSIEVRVIPNGSWTERQNSSESCKDSRSLYQLIQLLSKLYFQDFAFRETDQPVRESCSPSRNNLRSSMVRPRMGDDEYRAKEETSWMMALKGISTSKACNGSMRQFQDQRLLHKHLAPDRASLDLDEYMALNSWASRSVQDDMPKIRISQTIADIYYWR
jgi:hypothetical protein